MVIQKINGHSEGVVLVPFIDPSRIFAAMNTIAPRQPDATITDYQYFYNR